MAALHRLPAAGEATCCAPVDLGGCLAHARVGIGSSATASHSLRAAAVMHVSGGEQVS
jgi:hypothetical protein